MAEAPAPEKWVEAEDTYRVVLSVFDDIKDGLSLGLNGADCELISVETIDGLDGNPAFRLVMRRFGHGVGMSQRGAQQMAGGHDMDFMEILGFYYPGMSVERMEWPESGLYSLDAAGEPIGAARPKPTPLPTPLPLPELKDGEHIGTVNATTLNLRERPTTAARVVDILDKGRQVIVTGDADADGWVPVKTAEDEGYVKEEYLD
ncbi:MAG: SH3 domain-containing protein [Clostridia bacterium]|nr:SH3 domain-containing protein [Clostridia bacterium]